MFSARLDCKSGACLTGPVEGQDPRILGRVFDLGQGRYLSNYTSVTQGVYDLFVSIRVPAVTTAGTSVAPPLLQADTVMSMYGALEHDPTM